MPYFTNSNTIPRRGSRLVAPGLARIHGSVAAEHRPAAAKSVLAHDDWQDSQPVADFFIHTFWHFHGSAYSLAPWFAYTLAAIIQLTLLINVVAVGALIFIWMERKIAGRIQDRLGPTRVGGKFGWLQTLADGMKLITKEDLMPNGADGFLFKIAPYVSFCASFAAYLALPFAYDWVGQRLNVAVFFIIAVLGLEVFGVILAGYASASKWSLFGAMREAAQVVSYEVPLGICVVVPVLIAGNDGPGDDR